MENEKEVQVEPTEPASEPAPTEPVTEPAQVEPKETPKETPAEPVTEKKETETPKNEAVPQSEWQKTQERIAALESEKNKSELEKFESEYPIVKSEKYKQKWEDILKQKSTPGNKYENLSYSELLSLIRDYSVPQEPKPTPTPVPSINPSASPDVPQGDINSQVKQFMGLRYSEQEIESTNKR